MEKVSWIFKLFATAGVVLLAAAVWVAQSERSFVERSETVSGVVIANVLTRSTSHNGGTSYRYYYHPRVRFQTDTGADVQFVSGAGADPPSYHVNDTVTVLYDPQNPSNASIKGFFSLWGAAFVLMILGVAFSLFGGVPLAWMYRRKQVQAWLRSNGQQIQTTFDRVELDTSLTVDGSHPYRIVSQWLNPASKRVQAFKSDSIWYNPARYISGDTIGVWIDPHNPRRYSVDIGFLPRSED